MRRLIPLAPLHQPHHLAAIAAISKLYPDLAQVACFDTAFHHTQPEVAAAYALPRESQPKASGAMDFTACPMSILPACLPDVLGPMAANGRVVVAHLGSGASMCAMHRRQSVATTMGFTALDGLPMGSRCGNLDPGVVLYLIQEKGMTPQALSDLLYHSSGLLGVSGVSDDMRTLLASDDPLAASAVAFSSTGSAGSWARWPPALAGWTRSSSPRASASTPPKFVVACANRLAGSASILDGAANAAGAAKDHYGCKQNFRLGHSNE